ncbi:MAG: phosphoserine phosphatase [Ruminococcaceae bacterium]|nr:phosphoserine phosphatase [Oscillospiraceae bacterium]
MNVYDFDKTIYRGDSSTQFYFFALKKKKRVLLYLPLQFFAFIMMSLKIFSKTKAKGYFFSFFKCFKDIDALVAEFWKEKKDNIYKRYYVSHRADDVIVSASPQFLLDPVKSILNVERIIASPVDKKTGKFFGPNCYGEEKVTRFEEFYKKSEIETFYSDSFSDTPLAKLAKKSYIVRGEEEIPWEYAR